MLETNNYEFPYIEVFDGDKSLGKFVNMQAVNTYVQTHKVQKLSLRFGILQGKNNSLLIQQLIRKYHVR